MEQTGQLWVKQIAFKWANLIQAQSSRDLLPGSVFRNLIESASVPLTCIKERWAFIYFSGAERRVGAWGDYKRQTMFSSRDINCRIWRHYGKWTKKLGTDGQMEGRKEERTARKSQKNAILHPVWRLMQHLKASIQRSFLFCVVYCRSPVWLIINSCPTVNHFSPRVQTQQLSGGGFNMQVLKFTVQCKFLKH